MTSPKILHTLASRAGMGDAAYRELLHTRFHASSSKDLDEPQKRQLAAILRGMAGGEPAETRQAATGNQHQTSKKIWAFFYQLSDVSEKKLDAGYLAGFIKKAAGEEAARVVTAHWPKIELDALGPRWTWIVTEALKKRLAYEDARGTRVPAWEDRRKKAGLCDPPEAPADQTVRTKRREVEDDRLKDVPF